VSKVTEVGKGRKSRHSGPSLEIFRKSFKLSYLRYLSVVPYSAPHRTQYYRGPLVAVLFTLAYDGELATNRAIDFYDVAHALAGFQRSLALTIHVMINGEVITQAPSLRGAQILALPVEEGSWKFVAALVGSIFVLSQAPQNSVVGHLMTSAYDYVISETLGFHIDFSKTLGQQYEEMRRARVPLTQQPQSKLDAVIEKCQFSIKEMHRPIVWSQTATSANISSSTNRVVIPLTPTLSRETYEYIDVTQEEDISVRFRGWVSSYNMNTFKGRIFVPDEGRPVPFWLNENARTTNIVSRITASLSGNALLLASMEAMITCVGFRNVSKAGRLKSYRIINVV
jgi:hypothetical protein